MSLRGYFCSGHAQDSQAALIGSIARPLLRLRNDSDVDLEFTRSGIIDPLITVSTRPDMPIRVRARTSRDLHLVVKARRCPSDISLLSSGSYLNIDSAGADTDSIPASAGVDISALVGAAVAKACAKR